MISYELTIRNMAPRNATITSTGIAHTLLRKKTWGWPFKDMARRNRLSRVVAVLVAPTGLAEKHSPVALQTLATHCACALALAEVVTTGPRLTADCVRNTSSSQWKVEIKHKSVFCERT